ncbi:MAG: UDP-2,4-diacetamido-2,4,6-trideoxy-beta-L-altropyranose hydrolase [Lachnospiraceae bacterium]|nr:UDP-2,4-diacetamido-2,4,6-trideoxy-beta-L-altropyranose hydrolase [Lachnospiraceae bacterium]
MKILVIIPARGGSKRIPRKNVRLMNGRPLIMYSVANALSLKKDMDVDLAVSTDDEELSGIAADHGAEIVMRGEALSGDSVTLDPVIYDALVKMEERHEKHYDTVITMQATSPTLSRETLMKAIEYFEEGGFDTVISVVNRPHLSWTKKDGRIVKNYEERLNSQFLPPNYLETGAFLITKRECVNEKGRIGENVSVFETDPEEAVDIDTYADWIEAEAILKRKRVLFRAVGQRKLGMGHIYRCLSLAYKLIGHEVLFVTDSESEMGIEKLKSAFFPYEVIKDNDSYEKVLEEWKPDIVVNDILDTDEETVRLERRYAKRIVNFEDVGPGAYLADAVINALYENHPDKPGNVYEGSDYFFIRDEFLEENPKEFSAECRNVMIMFGGADPSDLTGRLYKICGELHDITPETQFHFITGFAYEKKELMKDIPEKNIFVHNDVKRVSLYMKKADLAVTSQGRTIYELASMGVPAIVLAQNEREAQHVFAGIQNGFINLGLGSRTDDKTVIQTMRWLIETPNVRKEMRNIELTNEFRMGQKRVIDIILKERA